MSTCTLPKKQNTVSRHWHHLTRDVPVLPDQTEKTSVFVQEVFRIIFFAHLQGWKGGTNIRGGDMGLDGACFILLRLGRALFTLFTHTTWGKFATSRDMWFVYRILKEKLVHFELSGFLSRKRDVVSENLHLFVSSKSNLKLGLKAMFILVL